VRWPFFIEISVQNVSTAVLCIFKSPQEVSGPFLAPHSVQVTQRLCLHLQSPQGVSGPSFSPITVQVYSPLCSASSISTVCDGPVPFKTSVQFIPLGLHSSIPQEVSGPFYTPQSSFLTLCSASSISTGGEWPLLSLQYQVQFTTVCMHLQSPHSEWPPFFQSQPQSTFTHRVLCSSSPKSVSALLSSTIPVPVYSLCVCIFIGHGR